MAINEKPNQPKSRAEELREAAKATKLPLPPWTIENLGEAEYCRIARTLGFFNPKSEDKNYRPSLDPTLFVDIIREQHKTKE